MKKPLRILMVEDSEDDALLMIREFKRGGYDLVYERVETAKAMQKSLQEKPWDIILCDYQMPQFNGLAAIALLKETGIDIPLIIVSGAIGEEMAVECMRLGACDYVMKNNLSRLASAVERELQEAESRRQRKQAEAALQESHTKLEKNLMGAIDVISGTIEAKGPYPPGHHRHVSALASAIAQEMGLTDFQAQGIELAAAVYDIGLMTVPIEFLQDNERLEGLKLTMYQGYPQAGYDALKKLEFPWPIAEIILQHRECYDGSGFPQGIRGKEILIEARILAVVVALEDLMTHKSFRNAFSLNEALEEISTHSGSRYDPGVVPACLRLFKEKGYKMKE